MKKLTLPTVILILVLVGSCTKDKLVTVNGISQGYVRDVYSNEPISGAKITYKIGEKSDSVTTDADGFFSVKGLPAGYTSLTVTKTGYAGETSDTWIEPLQSPAAVKNGGSVDSYDDVTLNMAPLTASFKGTILKYVSNTDEIRPAAGFDLSISFSDNYSPSYFTTTTDAKGDFSLSNLPAGIYATVTVQPHSDSDNYYYRTYSETFIPNTTTEWYPTLQRSDKGIVLVSTSLDIGNGQYTQSLPVSDNIILTFSKPVSANNTKLFGYITLTGTPLDINADVSFNGSAVTINPPADLAHSTTYTLSFKIYSDTPGDYISKDIQFVTAN